CCTLTSLFFFYGYGAHRALHSFPTRRSSDLHVEHAGEHALGGGPAGRVLEPALAHLHVPVAEFRPGELVNGARHLAEVVALQLLDRKSTRLNSSHVAISYAVFCLKKKIKKKL